MYDSLDTTDLNEAATARRAHGGIATAFIKSYRAGTTMSAAAFLESYCGDVAEAAAAFSESFRRQGHGDEQSERMGRVAVERYTTVDEEDDLASVFEASYLNQGKSPAEAKRLAEVAARNPHETRQKGIQNVR